MDLLPSAGLLLAPAGRPQLQRHLGGAADGDGEAGPGHGDVRREGLRVWGLARLAWGAAHEVLGVPGGGGGCFGRCGFGEVVAFMRVLSSMSGVQVYDGSFAEMLKVSRREVHVLVKYAIPAVCLWLRRELKRFLQCPGAGRGGPTAHPALGKQRGWTRKRNQFFLGFRV